MRTLVMKFGGSTVGTTTALTQLVSIVLTERERWDRLILVVSALDGITDQLIEAAHFAQLSQRRGYRRIAATLRARHLALVEHLIKPAERASLLPAIDGLLYDMLDICQMLSDNPLSANQTAIDAIIGIGERLSARITAALLRQNNLRSVAIDTTDLIITDDSYGNATPNMDLTRENINSQLVPMLQRGILPVLTGFIGATPSGNPTTLGRGGSDYTASIMGVCMSAEEVWIWTDVDGMMSADPLDVPSAQNIPQLSYDEAAELAYFGARVLHSKMIGMLRERAIPVRVRNVYMPQASGTLIKGLPNIADVDRLQAVTLISGVALTAEHRGSLAPISALVDEVFFRTTGNRAEIMIAAQGPLASLVCFIVPTTASPNAVHDLQLALHDRIRSESTLHGWSVKTVSVVTAVGAALERSHDLGASILTSLAGLRILGAAYSPSRCGMSIIANTQDAEEALERIHTLIATVRPISNE
jgi:bifunctional aspartokinase / homoserine dehydrogenase 1